MSFVSFLHDESGAVTVDWVLISAMALGVTLAASAAVTLNTGEAVGNMFNTIEDNDFKDTTEVIQSWGLGL